MKKKIALILIALVLLVPFPLYLKDGGTVIYKAILYEVIDYHTILDLSEEGVEYGEGWEVKILGITVYQNIDW